MHCYTRVALKTVILAITYKLSLKLNLKKYIADECYQKLREMKMPNLAQSLFRNSHVKKQLKTPTLINFLIIELSHWKNLN